MLRLSTTFIPIIIIMHIYIWYHSLLQSFRYIHRIDRLCTWLSPSSPCSPCSPCSLCSPFHLLGTLLAVTGSVHLFLGLLINWPLYFPHLPIWPPTRNPDPLGFPRPKIDTHKDDIANPTHMLAYSNRWASLTQNLTSYPVNVNFKPRALTFDSVNFWKISKELPYVSVIFSLSWER